MTSELKIGFKAAAYLEFQEQLQRLELGLNDEDTLKPNLSRIVDYTETWLTAK
jgi:hypothetical protein